MKEQPGQAATRYPISIVAIVGNGLRHRYFVNELAAYFNLKGVVSEAKRPLPTGIVAEDDEVIREHFRQRDAAEDRYFTGNDSFMVSGSQLLTVPHGESNRLYVFDWIKQKQPDYIILYGSSIIGDPILSHFRGRVINMHLGLSPYYRGSGTNFWPLANREPECVGATIHLATLEVDGGPILAQCRPDVEISDLCHDFGCKTIIQGTKRMVRCVKEYARGSIRPVPQPGGGTVYRNRDFNAAAVRQMWHHLETGVVEEYLADLKQRLSKKPIVKI